MAPRIAPPVSAGSRRWESATRTDIAACWETAPSLIGGRRAPVAGVVTMDMTMLDVTDVPCDVGDVATLIGRDGGDEITVSELARDSAG